MSRTASTGVALVRLAGDASLTALDDELVMMNASIACMSNGDTAVRQNVSTPLAAWEWQLGWQAAPPPCRKDLSLPLETMFSAPANSSRHG